METKDELNYSMGILEKAVVELIAKTQEKVIEDRIEAGINARIDQYIKDTYGPIQRKTTVVINNVPVLENQVVHEEFETVLKFVKNNIPVYLHGPAGSGKNYMCKQVAEALGLNFYYTGAVTHEYKLTGFTDANGNYQETDFYKAVTKGGLFFLDEMDASVPEVLITLNACIANGYFDFPAPIGFTKVHPDFRVIAAGNTLGYGADSQYTGRYQLDATTLNRFSEVYVGYSPDIEMALGNNNLELVQFCRDYRKAAQDSCVQTVVSYRQISMLATMEKELGIKKAIKCCMIKGLDKDELCLIASKLTASKYNTELRQIINEMK